jgi:hypothetical protein
VVLTLASVAEQCHVYHPAPAGGAVFAPVQDQDPTSFKCCRDHAAAGTDPDSIEFHKC